MKENIIKSPLNNVKELKKRRLDCEYGRHEKCLCYLQTDAELKGYLDALEREKEFLRNHFCIQYLQVGRLVEERGGDIEERLAQIEDALKEGERK